MNKIITAILSVLLLAAFIPARYGMLLEVHPDTTWKPYIVILRNEYGQQTAKWVKGYYNPNSHGDTVATGKVAKFDFTNDNTKNIVGWNKCYLPLAGDSASYVVPTDANTGFSMHVWGNANWSPNWGANSRGVPPNDGGGFGNFSPSVDSAYWYNFSQIGSTGSNVFTMYIAGLNPNDLYKIEFISILIKKSAPDTANYSGLVIQQGRSITDTVMYSYNGIADNNTSKSITTKFLTTSYADTLNMHLGYIPNPSLGFGLINGLIITEYKIE